MGEATPGVSVRETGGQDGRFGLDGTPLAMEGTTLEYTFNRKHRRKPEQELWSFERSMPDKIDEFFAEKVALRNQYRFSRKRPNSNRRWNFPNQLTPIAADANRSSGNQLNL